MDQASSSDEASTTTSSTTAKLDNLTNSSTPPKEDEKKNEKTNHNSDESIDLIENSNKTDNATKEVLANDNDNDNDVNTNKNNGNKKEDEIYRLAGRPPLITILHLMIGPIISQVTGALYGILNTVWISHGIGEKGISAVATEMTLEGIGRAFGFFLMISASTKISQLFGQNKQEEATQVVCDLLRCTLICGAIVPVLILPLHDTLCQWFGASEETTRLGFQYILPLCAFSVFTCINLSCQGFLQAEGRTLLIGFIDLTALVVACGAICPLFLYGFKTGINSASIATIFADGVPGIVLTILYFRGKFGIKPKLNQLLKPFSKHTYQAITVGLSQLVSNLAACIPGIPIRNLIGMSCGGDARLFDLSMAAFNVCCRFYQFAVCVCIAVTTGFIAAGSYAYASKNYKRFLRLSLHAAWIACAWSVIATILSLTIPNQISRIFADGDDYLSYAKPILMNSNYAGFVRWVAFNCQAMLQALQRGGRAMIVSFLSNLVGFLGFAYLLYYTDKHNVLRLMYLYSLTMAFGAIVGIVMLTKPLYDLFKEAKTQSKDEVDGAEGKTLDDISEENYIDEVDEANSSSNQEVKNVTEM